MGNGNGHDNDDDDRKDLTRIEDLSEFLHEDDPDLESKFGDFDSSYQKADGTSTEVTGGLSLNELSDSVSDSDLDLTSEETPPLPDEVPETPPDVDLIEMPDMPVEDAEAEADSLSEEAFTFSEPEQEETSFEEVPAESSSDDFAFEETTSEESLPDSVSDSFSFEEQSTTSLDELEETTPAPPERFEEVKTFAQNFSYGQIQGGGNPPFSLVIRNLKFDEDKESIIALLSEFGLVSDQNLEETTKALELGSLLVPQISEYSAIVLAHKMRRYDCDIEVGLSDEVHPSKSGEHNPKGLVKKDSLKQNKVESFKLGSEQTPAKEILIATTEHLEGYVIKKYIGIQTSFAIVDEGELERLKYVQEQNRSDNPIHNYNPDESEASEYLTSERAFIDYKSSFDYLFVSLAEELKTKAQKEKANALLGLTYQLQPLPFEKNAQGRNCYQLTASATMAFVTPSL